MVLEICSEIILAIFSTEIKLSKMNSLSQCDILNSYYICLFAYSCEVHDVLITHNKFTPILQTSISTL